MWPARECFPLGTTRSVGLISCIDTAGNQIGATHRTSFGICVACFGVAIIMCTNLKLHLQILNLNLEVEQKGTLLSKHKQAELRGDAQMYQR
jgi:hypothetical protein